MNHLKISLRVLLFIAVMLPLSAATTAQAADATIAVTTAADPGTTSDGFCSLREAIINANANDQSGSAECAAGVGDDLITIPAGYTITLASALPDLSTQMTIQGGGAASTIIEATACDPVAGACGHEFRPLTVTGGPVTVADVTLRHGQCTQSPGSCSSFGFGGGGIYSSAGLTLSSVTLTGNRAARGGGLGQNGGTANVTVIGGAISGNVATNLGGGVYVDNGGTLTVENGAIIGGDAPGAGNQAAIGGGIMSAGSTVRIEDSTISGNTSGNQGGALYDQHGSVTILGSRIAGNTSAQGSGVYLQLGGVGTIDIQWSCVVGNNATSLVSAVGGQQVARHVWWGSAAGANQPGADTTSGNWDVSAPLSSPPVEGCATSPAPTPGKPANGAGSLKPPTLTWKKYTGAFQYEVQVDNNADFSSPEVVKSTRSTALKLPSLGYGLYHWRVKADLGWGVSTAWSADRTFVVTLLKTPRANASTRDTTPTFTWSADKPGGATQYTLCYDIDPSPLDGTCQPVTGLKHTPGAALPVGDVYWTVTIVDGANAGLTLPVQKFTIIN